MFWLLDLASVCCCGGQQRVCVAMSPRTGRPPLRKRLSLRALLWVSSLKSDIHTPHPNQKLHSYTTNRHYKRDLDTQPTSGGKAFTAPTVRLYLPGSRSRHETSLGYLHVQGSDRHGRHDLFSAGNVSCLSRAIPVRHPAAVGSRRRRPYWTNAQGSYYGYPLTTCVDNLRWRGDSSSCSPGGSGSEE